MNPFDTVTGLPVHPLVVHAAVVLWPLGVLGLLAMLLVPRLRNGFGWLTMLFLVVGGAAVYMSKESGEQLAHHIGEPKTHAEYADVLTLVTFLTLLLSLVWWALERRHSAATRRPVAADGVAGEPEAATAGRAHGAHTAGAAAKPSTLLRVLGPIAALLGLVSLVYTVLVGHTGAEAAWSGRIPTSDSSTAAAPAAPATAGPYTLAQVASHKDASSCWVAVSGNVYDLTKWISAHPGGQEPIKALCGTDGTKAFNDKHGDDGPNGKPQQALATYKIGALTS